MQNDNGYDRQAAWRSYQRFFPPALRLTEETMPSEEWWPWQELAVHVDRYPAGGPVKVVLLHGAGGYGRLLSPLGVALHTQGFEVVAPDMPGFGLTQAPARQNDWRFWVQLVQDLVAAERERDGRPVVLFGASIGGPLALHAAGGRDIDVAGLIATMLLDPREPAARAVLGPRWAPAWATGLLTRSPHILDGVRLPIALLTNMGAIANDPEMAKLCARDPLGGGNWVPLGFLRTFLTAEPPLEPEAFDRCPVLLVHPEQDRWTPLEHSRRLFERLRAPKELVVLENCGHFPLEEPGLSQLREAVTGFLASVAPPGN